MDVCPAEISGRFAVLTLVFWISLSVLFRWQKNVRQDQIPVSASDLPAALCAAIQRSEPWPCGDSCRCRVCSFSLTRAEADLAKSCPKCFQANPYTPGTGTRIGGGAKKAAGGAAPKKTAAAVSFRLLPAVGGL